MSWLFSRRLIDETMLNVHSLVQAKQRSFVGAHEKDCADEKARRGSFCVNLHSLLELAAEYSADTCLDGELSVQSNKMPMPQAFLSPDKTTTFSRLSRFGMTCELLTEGRGEELLMWFLAGFPAKTFHAPGKAQALTASEADSGQKWRGLLGRYDRDLCLWKTAQCSLIEDSGECLATFPRWGMTRNGVLYLLPTPERRTSANASGLLAAPTATANQLSPSMMKHPSCLMWATPTTMDSLPPKSADALHREATVARPGRSKPANLRDQVSNARNWPTPAARDYKGARKPETMAKTGRNPNTNSLPDAVEFQPIEPARNWPTPNASDHIQRKTSKSWAAKGRTNFVLSNPEVTGVEGGRLNPQWVEWLMGWPLGWTDLKPLAMDRFREWQQQHSIFCEVGRDEF